MGKGPSGDVYFIDPRVRTGRGETPVLALAHDASMTCSVAANSLGELVAREAVEAWARRERAAHAVRGYAMGTVKLVAARGGTPASKKATARKR